MQTVYREDLSHGFTKVSNTSFDKHEGLSDTAQLLWLRMLSMPTNWHFRATDMQRRWGLSEYKLGKAIKELKAAGLVRQWRWHEAGRWQWAYQVYEVAWAWRDAQPVEAEAEPVEADTIPKDLGPCKLGDIPENEYTKKQQERGEFVAALSGSRTEERYKRGAALLERLAAAGLVKGGDARERARWEACLRSAPSEVHFMLAFKEAHRRGEATPRYTAGILKNCVAQGVAPNSKETPRDLEDWVMWYGLGIDWRARRVIIGEEVVA